MNAKLIPTLATLVVAIASAIAMTSAMAQTSKAGLGQNGEAAVFGTAQMQSSSSVTLYGIVDAYVQTARGASTLSRVQSGGQSGSRIGLKGSEDLGNGLRA